MPLFSVVIPTYNRRERAVRAVRSVLDQRFTDYEIIVVDDGSSDGTAEALDALGGGLRILRQENRGPAAARNEAGRHASGAYLAFLDSDDRWPPWTLERYAALLREHRMPTWLFGSGFADAGAVGDGLTEGPCLARHFATFLECAAQTGVMPIMTGVALSRECFMRHGGFPESLRVGEDFDLWLRLGAEPGFVLMESPVAFVREHHAASLTEDIERSFAGLTELLGRERAGAYPGEGEAAFARRAMLSRHLIYYALVYGRRGRRDLAARFWLEVLRLQAASQFREPAFGGSRNSFLLSFPLFLASPRLHGLLRRAAGRPPIV
jgi:glycosyltransferase involved in cell wall biosynthesis